jgi:hypothetical protein
VRRKFGEDLHTVLIRTKLLLDHAVRKAAEAFTIRMKCRTSLRQRWLRMAVSRLSAEVDGDLQIIAVTT